MLKLTDERDLKRFIAGDRRILARWLTRIENRDMSFRTIQHQLFAKTGNAWRIGVTGPPGAGKSTLVDYLIGAARSRSETVGVVAFDPTSPFTGGALLGDRIRMVRSSGDEGVFIRSMATRGHLGGLAVGVDEACDLIDAFGRDYIFVETVGVGQSELEVADATDTTIVVLVPQSGDMIQAMKAGLMEIADVFVLNKNDQQGADEAHKELTQALELRAPSDGWIPTVVRTVADDGRGVDELDEAISLHREFVESSGIKAEKRNLRANEKVKRIVEERIQRALWKINKKKSADKKEKKHLVGTTVNPYEVADKLIQAFYEEICHGIDS